MSSVERGFVPITEAQSERVRIDIDLPPFIDKGRIGVNLRNIHLLCQIGGIGHLRIVGVDDAETSSAVPTVLGFDSQGTAYAGKTGTKVNTPIQEGRSLQDMDRSASVHSMVWAHTLIAVNMEEVANRINRDKRWAEGMRSAEAWSHYLNRGVKEGLSQQSTRHLILNLSTRDKLFTGTFVALAIFESALDPNTLPFPYPIDAIIHYFTIASGFNSIPHFRFGKSDRNVRYSFFSGPELDRALLLKIMAKTKRVIKPIEPRSK